MRSSPEFLSEFFKPFNGLDSEPVSIPIQLAVNLSLGDLINSHWKRIKKMIGGKSYEVDEVEKKLLKSCACSQAQLESNEFQMWVERMKRGSW